MAIFPASCAATEAANAEDFLDPVKFVFPALAQEITFPEGSVIETIVLLNVAFTCAIPLGTVLVILFLVLVLPFLTAFSCLANLVTPISLKPAYTAFFFPATVFFFPFRVRALHLVLWPRVGNPERCLIPR